MRAAPRISLWCVRHDGHLACGRRADIRDAVADTLRDAGYEVSEAENGKVALERLSELDDKPCLVLLDLMMPVMSGPELLKTLKEAHRLASLPVVVLSAAGTADDAKGARKFVRKPINTDVLLKRGGDGSRSLVAHSHQYGIGMSESSGGSCASSAA